MESQNSKRMISSTRYQAYVLASSLSFNKVNSMINDVTRSLDKGKSESERSCITVRVMRRWSKEKKKVVETKWNTIIVSLPEVIEELRNKNPDYKSATVDYDWKGFPTPKEELKETTNLHISNIPNDYSQEQAVKLILGLLLLKLIITY